MGRDNQPKERHARALARKKANRAGYDRILIISEGEKTEPLYFEEIRQHYRLHTTNMRVMKGAYGTTPQQVVDLARDECLKTQEWEQAFCVFDRDDHPKANFDNAIASAAALDKKYRNELKQPIRFTAIPSIPCFELWLLLHFDCVTQECHRNEVYSLQRQPDHLPGYDKGHGCEAQKRLVEFGISHRGAILAWSGISGKTDYSLPTRKSEDPFLLT